MHKKVREFLETKKQAERELYDEKKREILIELGLYEKDYTDEDGYSDEYPCGEYDQEIGVYRYYKKIPVPVSDEEFEEIKKCSKIQTHQPINNPVAITLAIIAWLIYIGGFIAGVVFGNVEVGRYYKEFHFTIALIYWFSALLSGTLLLGFSEIIKLLNDIKNK